MHVPGSSAAFDEHRNTSRVWPVPPEALPNALKALAHFRQSDLAMVRWIEEGHPILTDAEHVERFGETWKPRPKARASPG